ncbi:MAG: hypothetical protein IKG89_00595 [Oscillospiraceae bacterium]|nr:hypothetical protein [Oscillospiraceae bacterium]
MSKGKQFLDRWKTDYDFKTVTGAFSSLAMTVVFALYNGFLGVRHSSLWHGTICVYYIVLTGLRGVIITARKRLAPADGREDAGNKAYILAAALLLLLNLSLVIPVTLMVRQQKPVSLTLIPAIAMAAYTTYKVIMASINLKRRNRSADSLIRLLRTIGFIDALVSILVLQNTLIMVNTNGEDGEMLPLTAITSAAVMVTVLLLSAAAIIKGIARAKNRK